VPPAEHPPEAAARRPDPAPGPPGPAGRDRDLAGRDAAGRDAAGRDQDAAGRGAAGRDRDLAGRARNARPRDGLGRPLGRGADGEPPAADAPALAPAAALEAAQRLLDAGRPFHAHEVLEASWKAAPPAERDLWQGLAQLAVGLTHARRGNAAGAAALLRRGAARIRAYPDGGSPDGGSPDGAATYGIDPAALAAAAAGLAGRIESGGLTGLPPGALDLRLRAAPGPSPV
jgi:uncharacterized protein